MVTKPIRYADAVWTVAGLYFSPLDFARCSTINNTEVPGVFDLLSVTRKCWVAYRALWTLTLGMGLVWGWQAIRLWRFRRVPLRKACPRLSGSRLGTSRGTAVLVGDIQLLCAWGPLLYMVWIYSQIWFWATPETPVWDAARRHPMGKRNSREPVDMGSLRHVHCGRFWIRDMQPGLGLQEHGACTIAKVSSYLLSR